MNKKCPCFDVKRFGLVKSSVEKWGIAESDPDHDFHVNSKIFKEAWDFIKVLDKKIIETPWKYEHDLEKEDLPKESKNANNQGKAKFE